MPSSKDRNHDFQNSGSTRLSRLAVSWILTAASVFFVVGIMTYGGNRPPSKIATAPQLASDSSNFAAVSNVSIQINITSETESAPGSER